MTKRRLHLVIVGPQGSGKGTQAKTLAGTFGLLYLGVGEMLRALAGEGSDLGHQVKATIDQGNLMPDETTAKLVEDRLRGLPADQGFILDGFPRTLGQAGLLKTMLERIDRLDPKPVFILLEVPTGEVLSRIHKRRQIEQRTDETDEAVQRRLALYKRHTRPIIESVESWADVRRIDGRPPIKTVTEAILNELGDGKEET